MLNQINFDDTAFLIRGRDGGSAAWHYILVPLDKVASLKALPTGDTVDITAFGQVIRYRNHRGEIITMSQWGTNPSQMIEAWLSELCGQ